MLHDAVCQAQVFFGINPVQTCTNHGDGATTRRSCVIGKMAFQRPLMGSTINAQRQPGHHDQTRFAECFGKGMGVKQTLRCWVAAADDGNAVSGGLMADAVIGERT